MTGDVALNERDPIAVFARADLLHSKRRTELSRNIGVQGGAQAALIGPSATIALVVGVIVVLVAPESTIEACLT